MRWITTCCLLVVSCTNTNGPDNAPSDAGASNDGAPTTAIPPSGPIVLASNQVVASTIAMDDVNVYWVNSGTLGGVYKLPKAGGTRSTLYDGATTKANSLLVDDASLYFPTGEAILAVPTAGGASRLVARAAAGKIAIANKEIYWIERIVPSNSESKLQAKRVPVTSGTETTIALPDSLYNLADELMSIVACSDAVYASFFPVGGVVRIPLDRSTPTVVNIPQAYSLACDAERLYYGVADTLNAIVKPNGSTERLTAAQFPFGITTDESFVYFSESLSASGRISKIPKRGGSGVTLAQGQDRPRTVLVDASSVYWNNFGEGSIKKASK